MPGDRGRRPVRRGLLLPQDRLQPLLSGALFFFACVIFANIVVAFLGRRLALSKPDLVLIYCMLLMAVTVPTWGLMFFLIGTLVYPFYFATPENRFEDLFFDYIPQWMVPRDPEAIKGYYEGLPRGTPIPWEVWVEPMAWWLGLVVVMGFMLICLSGILHRQWSTHERLAYPMMQLRQGMLAGEEGAGSKIAPLFRNPVMWVGFPALRLPDHEGAQLPLPLPARPRPRPRLRPLGAPGQRVPAEPSAGGPAPSGSRR